MLRVQDVMTTDVKTVTPDTPAEVAWQRMITAGVHHLVVTRGDDVVGLFSDRDAGGRRGTRARQGHTVSELMSHPPVCVAADVPVRKAANLMRGRSIGSLVVCTAPGRLRGIVTTADLLELLGRGAQHPVVENRRWTLKNRGDRRPAHVTGQAKVMSGRR
jgi:CBS domain-containing protein